MRILTRYLLRAHAGPFLFSLTAITGLLFLTSVAQRLEDLAGKGLEWAVIREFLILTLPHTVALTLPMAVLVSVLYAFSSLTGTNEFTAMKSVGIRPQRVMVPLLVAGALVGCVMFYFNDTILPSSNHELRNLLNDIRRKSPTLVFREGVVNPIQTEDRGVSYYLSAATIDPVTNRMTDVAIFDVADPLRQRTIYADWATMAFNETRTDLFLSLYDGVTYETVPRQEGEFQQTVFAKQVVPFRGIGNVFEVGATAERGDREMSIAQLDSAALEQATQRNELLDRAKDEAVAAVLGALGVRNPMTSDESDSQTTQVAPVSLSPSARGLAPTSVNLEEREEESILALDPFTQGVATGARRNADVATVMAKQINSKMVEKHKKYTLAVACLVFVLVGGPLAIRFPGAGLGLVIGASSIIFAIYWAGLIGGESLGNRLVAPPSLTMWLPNLIFGSAGVWLYLSMGREVGSTRGSSLDELFHALSKRFRTPVRLEREPGELGGDSPA